MFYLIHLFYFILFYCLLLLFKIIGMDINGVVIFSGCQVAVTRNRLSLQNLRTTMKKIHRSLPFSVCQGSRSIKSGEIYSINSDDIACATNCLPRVRPRLAACHEIDGLPCESNGSVCVGFYEFSLLFSDFVR